MKKLFLSLVLLLALCLVGVGCGKENEMDKEFELLTAEDIRNYDGTIKISFRVPSGINATALQTLIPKFEAQWNGKIKVDLNIESSGYDGVRKTTLLDLNDKIAPTMVMGYPDHFAEYFSGNHIIDLNPYIEAEGESFDIQDFVQSYLDENRISDVNDHLYGLPLNKSTEIMVYNKTVFETMGYAIPETWAEVEALAEQIVKDCQEGKLDTIIPFAKGEKTPSQYLKEGLFVPFAYDSVDNAFITMSRQFKAEYIGRDNITKGYALFDNEKIREGLNYFQGLAKKGYYAVAETFESSYASDAFEKVQTVATFGSSAGVGYNVPEAGNFDIAVARIPYYSEDAKYVIQQGTNICILDQSTNEQRAAAWQLCKYLTSTEGTAEFCMLTGSYLPVRYSAMESEVYQEYLNNPYEDAIYDVEAVKVALSYEEAGFKMFTDIPFIGSATIRDTVGSMYVDIIVNKENIDDMIKLALKTLGPAYQKK